MSDRKLYVGATAHCTIYIDQDDIRHLARISGNQSQVHVNWQTAVAAGFGKLVAQPALLEAYVEAVIANHRGGQSLSNCRKTTHIEHYASPHAGKPLRRRHAFLPLDRRGPKTLIPRLLGP